MADFSLSPQCDPDSLRGRKTLIRGEVNRGKTVLLSRILCAFLASGETDLAVLDMAPDFVRGVGGKMPLASESRFPYYQTTIHAPRMSGRTPEETRILAQGNARRLEFLFSRILSKPPAVLLVNDVSIYLQAGSLHRLRAVLSTCPTVVMNGYWGRSLGGAELGRRERAQMQKLAATCDRVIDV